MATLLQPWKIYESCKSPAKEKTNHYTFNIIFCFIFVVLWGKPSDADQERVGLKLKKNMARWCCLIVDAQEESLTMSTLQLSGYIDIL
jgi:hypothetical protein